MSLQMMTKDKKTRQVAGDFDDEEMMKLFAAFDIPVKSRAGDAEPLLVHLERLGKAKLDALRAQYFISDDADSEQPSCWQDAAKLRDALASFRTILDHDQAAYLIQQIWANPRKRPPDPPGREETDELIAATADMIARVDEAIRGRAVKVRLCFDPALL